MNESDDTDVLLDISPVSIIRDAEMKPVDLDEKYGMEYQKCNASKVKCHELSQENVRRHNSNNSPTKNYNSTRPFIKTAESVVSTICSPDRDRFQVSYQEDQLISSTPIQKYALSTDNETTQARLYESPSLCSNISLETIIKVSDKHQNCKNSNNTRMPEIDHLNANRIFTADLFTLTQHSDSCESYLRKRMSEDPQISQQAKLAENIPSTQLALDKNDKITVYYKRGMFKNFEDSMDSINSKFHDTLNTAEISNRNPECVSCPTCKHSHAIKNETQSKSDSKAHNNREVLDNCRFSKNHLEKLLQHDNKIDVKSLSSINNDKKGDDVKPVYDETALAILEIEADIAKHVASMEAKLANNQKESNDITNVPKNQRDTENKSPHLSHLNDVFNYKTDDSVSPISLQYFENMFKEEHMRRSHLEKTIQGLQGRLLEYQQRLSIAVRVDQNKNEAINDIKANNKKLTSELKHLNSLYDILYAEHDELVNYEKLNEKKLSNALNSLAELQKEYDKLNFDNEANKKKHAELISSLQNQITELQNNHKGEETVQKELVKTTTRLEKLEHQINSVNTITYSKLSII